MSDNHKKKILKEILDIIVKFGNIKGSSIYALDVEPERLAYSLIVRAKAIIEKVIGSDSIYYKQIEEIQKTDIPLKYISIKAIQGSFEAFYNDYKKDLIEIEDLSLTPLKYEKIIEDIDLKDSTYQDVINEINGTYKNHFFTSMYILIRKLLENLLYDCLKKYYGAQHKEMFFNQAENRHHGFGNLRKNFSKLINEADFIEDVDKIDQKIIDLLKEFKDSGDINAHSLFNFPHQRFVEDKKDEINILLNKLMSILDKT